MRGEVGVKREDNEITLPSAPTSMRRSSCSCEDCRLGAEKDERERCFGPCPVTEEEVKEEERKEDVIPFAMAVNPGPPSFMLRLKSRKWRQEVDGLLAPAPPPPPAMISPRM